MKILDKIDIILNEKLVESVGKWTHKNKNLDVYSDGNTIRNTWIFQFSKTPNDRAVLSVTKKITWKHKGKVNSVNRPIPEKEETYSVELGSVIGPYFNGEYTTKPKAMNVAKHIMKGGLIPTSGKIPLPTINGVPLKTFKDIADKIDYS